ncbi:CoF synthetase [Paenibacillus cisolokensis]|uniref:AMP-binding protein n=1 Tax=Paenibacillus cisolokensis TaxID=1658519 RepID=UPI003D26CF5C
MGKQFGQEGASLVITPEELETVIVKVAACCPWYVPWAGLDVRSDIGALAQLPFVTSPVLERHYYTADNMLATRPGISEYRTSGTSSGRRKSIYYTPSDEDAYLRIKRDVYRTILGSGSYRTALADMGTGHAEATAVEVFRQLGMKAESISYKLPIARHLEKLQSFRPEVLYTMPSILERIVLASPNPAHYGIRQVILVGEIASPGWIAGIAERLGLPTACITDTYGSIEIGTMAYYSHQLGRYLLTEGLVAEGIGTEQLGQGIDPLPPGEQVLVLTSTVREAFPAIRYVTYDVVRDLRPIMVDGMKRMSFHSVVKRIGPDLKHGEKISIYDIEDIVYRHLGQVVIRVHMDVHGLTVYVDSGGSNGAAAPSIPQSQLDAVRDELEERIPEISAMVRAGLVGRIQVVAGSPEGGGAREAVKLKRIYYDK